MQNVIAWIVKVTTAISTSWPVLQWVLKIFPNLGFVAKLAEIANKIATDPKYPFLDVLRDIGEVFADAVQPIPGPPGASEATTPSFIDVYSASETASAYKMLPTDTQQYVVDEFNRLSSSSSLISSIPWPIITVFSQVLGPLAKQVITFFLERWLSNQKALKAAA